MAATESTMLPLATPAPDFTLPDTMSGQSRSLAELAGSEGTLIAFICNHCPFVLHVKDQLIALANDYRDRGIGFIAISSNSIETHPQDGPEHMRALMQDWGQPFDAYLYDASQAIAKAYQAACTPDFYLFNADLKLVYRGRLDNARPGNEVPLTGADLRDSLEALLAGEAPLAEQYPSLGCNIKWKPTVTS
ncbi:MAG: thioredoxin family protein [Methylococcales bacterium]|nr:thioredoxin family protein [Methylococcales bacterium]